jgi:hypothetical protein
MTKAQYRKTWEAKLLAEGKVCEKHSDRPKTTKHGCYGCYHSYRWHNDPEFKARRNARHKEYVGNNRQRINAIAKKWRDANPEKHRDNVKKSIAKRKEREAERGTNE